MGQPVEEEGPSDAEVGAAIRGEVRVERKLLGDRRVVHFTVGLNHGKGWRIDKYLHAILPTMSRGLLRRWIEQGFCTVNGQVADFRQKSKPGTVVHLDAPVRPADQSDEPQPLIILQSGPGYAVANKPAGQLPHQAGRFLTGTLLNQLQDWWGEQGHDPAEVRLVNRIDRDTSGIVLASLTLKAHNVLAEAMENRDLRKEYRAIVRGVPKAPTGSWKDPILEADELSIAMRIDPRGKPSHTDYEIIEIAEGGRYSLLRVLLHTGRQHQIRIHAAHNGYPLVGDWVYGEPCEELIGQALHAALLAFPDPEQPAQTLTVEAPLPGVVGDLWQHLRGGGELTPRELTPDERIRLGQQDDARRLPEWLSATDRAAIEKELGR